MSIRQPPSLVELIAAGLIAATRIPGAVKRALS